MESIRLVGRLVLSGEIRALTGLHIGGTTGGLDIGGVDLPVLRHAVTQQPYIPGSSLRGKMRCLLERELGLPLNQAIGQVRIHSCEKQDPYAACPVCKIFGVPGERDFAQPARLIVRDVQLAPDSVRELEGKKMGLPFTEVKTEVAIDRITSAAVPRQHERVPAGAVFSPCEMVFCFYQIEGCSRDGDLVLFPRLVEAMELLEDDYLGGQGTRGSGKVKFEGFKAVYKPAEYYRREEGAAMIELGKDLDVGGLRQAGLLATIRRVLAAGQEA